MNLNKKNKEVATLLNFDSKANFVFQVYTLQLLLKILDIFWNLTIFNKQQISTQDIVIAGFLISNSIGHIY